MQNKPIYPISVLSELLQVHQRTLRIYDNEGILVPLRSTKNRRLYSNNDLEKAKLILYLTRNLALNLSGVKTVIALLEEFKVSSKKYIETMQKIAKIKNINTNENVFKTSKRGRKPISK